VKISDFLQKNLWAIIAGIVIAWNGYLVGTERMSARITKLEDQITALTKKAEHNDERLKGRYGFMQCSVRTMDKILDKFKVNPPCEMTIPE